MTVTLKKQLVFLIFGLSGFCALVYEILWAKYLSLTFGATIQAVSIVSATFMGGLALGGYLIGRCADCHDKPLRVYGFLELGIALSALLFPISLSLAERCYSLASQAYPGDADFFILRLFFSILMLLPPAVFIGGTFPLMCRYLASKEVDGRIGSLYALNTLGATMGAFGTGYIFIPRLGMSQTGLLAILLNLLIGAAALTLSRNTRLSAGTRVEFLNRKQLPSLIPGHRLLLFSIAMIGAFALAYEILWTRVLLLFLGNTSYAFSLMLSAYLVGIALGGSIFARRLRPETNVKKLFVVLTTLMGLSILVTAPFYDRLPYLFQAAHNVSDERWWLLSLFSYLLVFAVMAGPTILAGSLLPAAVALLAPGQFRTGEGVGLVVLHNTFGAVIGSLAAGFGLIPWLGLFGSFRLLAILNLLLALILYLRSRFRWRAAGFILAGSAVTLLLVLLPESWDQRLMNSGVYYYAPRYEIRGGLGKVVKSKKLLKVFVGTETTVAVYNSSSGKHRIFAVNGKSDGSTGADMNTQILVGQLPLLLHPRPLEVMVIGLGTGITLRGMSDHPVERIDCVEISPEVVKAETYFRHANKGALAHPKVRLQMEDGRNHLLTHRGSYDVIVSEPSNPWQSGNANLFTADFYALAASKLKQDGFFCQWIGLYDMTTENLRIACNTFLHSFPRAVAFIVDSDLILVGAQQPLKFDYMQLRQRMGQPGIAEALHAIGIESPGELLAKHFLYTETALKTLSFGAALNTDDRPVLEYSARYTLGEKTLGKFQEQNIKALNEAAGEVSIPLVNLGPSGVMVEAVYRELGLNFAKNGRKAEAAWLMGKAFYLGARRPERNQASAKKAS